MKHIPLHIFISVFWITGFLFSCQPKNNNTWADELIETTESEEFAEDFYEEEDELFFSEEEPVYKEYETENLQRIKAYKAEPVEGVFISEETWKEKTEGTAYREKEKEEKQPFEFKPRKPFNPDFALFKVFAYLLVFAAIGALLFVLIRNYIKSGKSTDKAVFQGYHFGEISEEELKNLDTEDFITKAEKAGDFKAAFRLRYLQLLKKMVELKWVRFKKDFTNREYLRQLSGTETVRDFALLTLYFDRYWYGDVNIDKETYRKTVPLFRQIETRLEKGAKT